MKTLDISTYGMSCRMNCVSGPMSIVFSICLNIVAKKMLTPDVITMIIGTNRNIDV